MFLFLKMRQVPSLFLLPTCLLLWSIPQQQHDVMGSPVVSIPTLGNFRGGTTEEGIMKRFAFSGGQSVDSRMPSLFNAEEAEYNRFAACLAATEGLRRMRDQALLDRQSAVAADPDSPTLSQDEERKIADQYQANSGRVLRAMGMSVDRFNDLGREISRDENLKEKVRKRCHFEVILIG
jgi:Domain of unknown function (DUF4168)